MKVESKNPIPFLTHKKIFQGELTKLENISLYVFKSGKFKETISESKAKEIINFCNDKEGKKEVKADAGNHVTENKPKKRGRPSLVNRIFNK